jgi:hypothetical protein
VNCDVPVPRLPNQNQDINLAAAAQMYVSRLGRLRENTVAFMHGIEMTKFGEFGQAIFSQPFKELKSLQNLYTNHFNPPF